jgi:hypothetical protein
MASNVPARDLKKIFQEMSKMKDEDLDFQSPDSSMESMRWFEEEATRAYVEITDANLNNKNVKNQILRNSIRDYWVPKQLPGTMWTFSYQPETKDLDYWDRFPLILRMIDNSDDPDSFLGINLHYLYPRFRRALMLFNLERLIGDVTDPNSRIVGFDVTKLSKFPNKYGKVCIRRYKYSNMLTKAVRIPPENWIKAVYLPTHQFVGAKPAKVWLESYKRLKRLGLKEQ